MSGPAGYTATVLFVGLGSIGTRHLRNLTQLAAQRGLGLAVDALRSGAKPGQLPETTSALLARQITGFDQLRPYYDLVFITNPTSLHAGVLARLRGRAGCYFIEKPIFETADPAALAADLAAASGRPLAAPAGERFDILAALGLDAASGQRAYVAAPMRWCGVMQALKRRLPGLAVYSARAICSSYLPGWRPDVDYRTVYSAHRALGGGVGIDLIHEWDYLVDLFGMPRQVHGFAGRYSHLEIDSDDLAVYIARYPTLLAELHLDYFGRSYRRSLELFCRNGAVTADFGAGTLTLEDGSVERYEEPVNERYLREMAYFLDYAFGPDGPGRPAPEGAASLNPPETALRVLALTLGQPLPKG